MPKKGKEKVFVYLPSPMITRSICLALCEDFDVYGWGETAEPGLEDVEGFDLFVMDLAFQKGALWRELEGRKKGGRTPVLWIGGPKAPKVEGNYLAKPFDREHLLSAVCEPLKITPKTLEERRLVPASAWEDEGPQPDSDGGKPEE